MDQLHFSLGAFASHFLKCELVVWWMTEQRDSAEWGGKVTWQGSVFSQVAFMVIINKKQTLNKVFSCIFCAEIRKMSALTIMFKCVDERVMRGRGATMVSRWLFTKISSVIQNKRLRKDSAQCDCSSKWKEGAGSWWGAVLFPIFFLCKISWICWSGFLWCFEQHRNWILRLILS